MDFNYTDLPTLEEVKFTKRAIFVDLETSGFQSNIPDACTLSIGAVLMDKTGEVTDEFYQVICPSDDLIAKISPGATAVNGLTEDILRAEGIPAVEAWDRFDAWLRGQKPKFTTTDPQYIGQNPGFDLAFLAHESPVTVKRYGWVKTRVFDVIELYQVAESKFSVPYLGKGRKGKNGNGIAKALQVKGEPEVHNALEGARLNYRNFTRLAQIQRKWHNEQK
jgi:DNA polymerase III epsilon subunit-like protein